MNYKEIIYLPKFLFLCILSLTFGMFAYKKGMTYVYKLNDKWM